MTPGRSLVALALPLLLAPGLGAAGLSPGDAEDLFGRLRELATRIGARSDIALALDRATGSLRVTHGPAGNRRTHRAPAFMLRFEERSRGAGVEAAISYRGVLACRPGTGRCLVPDPPVAGGASRDAVEVFELGEVAGRARELIHLYRPLSKGLPIFFTPPPGFVEDTFVARFDAGSRGLAAALGRTGSPDAVVARLAVVFEEEVRPARDRFHEWTLRYPEDARRELDARIQGRVVAGLRAVAEAADAFRAAHPARGVLVDEVLAGEGSPEVRAFAGVRELLLSVNDQLLRDHQLRLDGGGRLLLAEWPAPLEGWMVIDPHRAVIEGGPAGIRLACVGGAGCLEGGPAEIFLPFQDAGETRVDTRIRAAEEWLGGILAALRVLVPRDGVVWRETPGARVKVKYAGGREVGRWVYPRRKAGT